MYYCLRTSGNPSCNYGCHKYSDMTESSSCGCTGCGGGDNNNGVDPCTARRLDTEPRDTSTAASSNNKFVGDRATDELQHVLGMQPLINGEATTEIPSIGVDEETESILDTVPDDNTDSASSYFTVTRPPTWMGPKMEGGEVTANAGEPAMDGEDGGPYCSARDFPCGEGDEIESGMCYICHLASGAGYRQLCIPEDFSDIIRVLQSDYCGPCVGGFRIVFDNF